MLFLVVLSQFELFKEAFVCIAILNYFETSTTADCASLPALFLENCNKSIVSFPVCFFPNPKMLACCQISSFLVLVELRSSAVWLWMVWAYSQHHSHTAAACRIRKISCLQIIGLELFSIITYLLINIYFKYSRDNVTIQNAPWHWNETKDNCMLNLKQKKWDKIRFFLLVTSLTWLANINDSSVNFR